MKKFITVMLLITITFMYDTKLLGDTIYNTYDKIFVTHNLKIVSNENKLKENEYHNETFTTYVEETDKLDVSNKSELINVYYTAINRGYDNLTFYCNDEYVNCMNDIKELDEENTKFSYINQIVNVYNSYNSIESSYLNQRVDIKINKKYTKDDINKINNRIDEIITELNINDYDSVEDKIRVFHDYIADTNTYDQEMADNKNSIYHSDIAIGTLFEGKSICSGYTDTMSIFLDRINVKNVRVSTDNHVWNALYLNDNWYHIDLTWDDPVTTDNSNVISHNYFLIDTTELLEKNDNEHNFNTEVYDFLY